MTHEIWFGLIMDITTVWSYIIFTMLIVNTEIEHYRVIISHASLLIVPYYEEKNITILIKTKFHNKDVIR